MNESRRSSDTEIALLRQAVANITERMQQREAENKAAAIQTEQEAKARILAIEAEIAILKSDRAKLSGGIIFIIAIGAMVMWFVTFGQNVLKLMGKA